MFQLLYHNVVQRNASFHYDNGKINKIENKRNTRQKKSIKHAIHTQLTVILEFLCALINVNLRYFNGLRFPKIEINLKIFLSKNE